VAGGAAAGVAIAAGRGWSEFGVNAGGPQEEAGGLRRLPASGAIRLLKYLEISLNYKRDKPEEMVFKHARFARESFPKSHSNSLFIRLIQRIKLNSVKFLSVL
jgi:hypothetical protein